MKKVKDFFISIVYSIALILGLIFVLIVSVPLAILVTISSIINTLSDALHKSFKAVWLWVLDVYKRLLDLSGKGDEIDE